MPLIFSQLDKMQLQVLNVSTKGMAYYFQSLKSGQDKVSNVSTVSDVVPYLLCGGHKAVLSAYTGNNVSMYSYWSWLIRNYLCQFIPCFWYTLLINLPELQLYLSTCERHQQTPRFHSILPSFTFSL